ncbi:MAG TPA: glycosyltransferase [Candidatus Paceibacterota bacterium]|nr:glycosyltransferase [Candidatus Paceibacterota bacterium]
MRLLVVTQAVDLDDPVLSVYHEWLVVLAGHFPELEVICLKEGRHILPANVRVHSLGKERGRTIRLQYAIRFLSLVWRLRNRYDRVFVHMNQEYLLLAGWLWQILGKPAFLWRNHHHGSFLTDIAASFCKHVFCTSKHSYTAKYAKTRRMPVGIETERFSKPDNTPEPHSILFFGRLSPSKRADMFVDALGLLKQRGVLFSASIIGSPLPEHEGYARDLKERITQTGLTEHVAIRPGVPHQEAPSYFHSHEIFVNASPSGMLDKTIFEAAAAGCFILAASDDIRDMVDDSHWFSSASELAQRLEVVLRAGVPAVDRDNLLSFAQGHSLSRLGSALTEVIVKA